MASPDIPTPPLVRQTSFGPLAGQASSNFTAARQIPSRCGPRNCCQSPGVEAFGDWALAKPIMASQMPQAKFLIQNNRFDAREYCVMAAPLMDSQPQAIGSARDRKIWTEK